MLELAQTERRGRDGLATQALQHDKLSGLRVTDARLTRSRCRSRRRLKKRVGR